MARPAKQQDDRRGFRTTVRWTGEERVQLELDAQAAALPVAEFLRRLYLRRRLSVPEKRPLDQPTLTALHRLGVSINSTAHTAHINRRLPPDLPQCCDRWLYALAVMLPDAKGLDREAVFQIERIGNNLVQLSRLAEDTGGAVPAPLAAVADRVDRLLREVAAHGA
jgi:hypothetical protein